MIYTSVLNKWPVFEAWTFPKAFQCLQTMTGLSLFDEASKKANCAAEQREDQALCCLSEVWTLAVEH